MKKISLCIVGAGSRGTGYARYAAENPEQAEVVGIAEPRDEYRKRITEEHSVSPEYTADDWKTLAEKEKFADAVIIATQDTMHSDPAVAFAEKGYNILLEKPMAPSAEECIRIVDAVKDKDIIFCVCHVLRYTEYTRNIKELVKAGVIGNPVNIQRLEPVGYWHQAHSFVRGNWRREDASSSMLLAKCCHDLDWIRYIMGVPCESVSSFGTLKHFRKEEKPEGAGERCVECAFEPKCPYSARKIYLKRVAWGKTGWPVNILAPEVTEKSIADAVENSPYGRCVYSCDNDVVDNQVVNMLFEGGGTASLTMTAFTEATHRKTRIFGTKGMLEGDGSLIRHFDFLTDTWEEIKTEAGDHSILGGHGGGDLSLMKSFISAVGNNDSEAILSGPEETLETHMMVFAAEKARRENTVVAVKDI